MAQQPYNRIYTEEKWALVNKENKDILEDYLLELKAQKKKESTIYQYKNDLRILCIYVLDNCENKAFTELGRKDFRRLVLWLTDTCSVSNARANRLMSAVRTLLSYIEDDDDYEDYEINAAAKVKGLPKEAVRDVVFLSDSDILALWQKLMDDKGYRDATLLGILYDSGSRKNEIAQVKRDSIKEDANATNIVTGKRGKKFPVLYFRLTKEAFKKYNETRTDDNPMLFINNAGNTATGGNIYDWVIDWRKDLKEITGQDYEINVHTFRHCYIENFLKGEHYLCRELNLGKVPLEKVKSLAHHESSDTTLGYAQNDESRDIEELLGIKL